MTITNTTVRTLYAGDGIVTSFAIAFDYRAESQVVVWLRDESVSPATETLQVEGAGNDYTLTGADPVAGTLPTTVEMNVSPAATEKLLVIRVTAKQQQVDFQSNTRFDVEANEGELDKQTQVDQEVCEKIDRAMVLPVTSAADPTLPEPEADKGLVWNGTADALVNIDLATQAELDAHTSDTTIHFTEASIDHDNIANNGVNTHAQIDTHIATVTGNPHVVTFTEAVAADGTTDVTGAELETLTDGSNADALHEHTVLVDSGGGTVIEAQTDESVQFNQASAPSNPPASQNRAYFRSDDQLYRRNSSGKELLTRERNEDMTLTRGTDDLVTSLVYGNGDNVTINRDAEGVVTSVVHDRWTATVNRSGGLITSITYS